MKYILPQEWEAQGKYFNYKQQKIFYQTAGAGEILVCIHGFPTSGWDWYKMWDKLTAHFKVIAPDMVGFGFSDKPRNYAYSIHDQADIHEALLAHLQIDTVHLLSHDYGDTVAQELIARYNERKKLGKAGLEIKSLCLLNGGIFPEMHRARRVQKLLQKPFIGWLISQLLNEKQFQKGFSEIFGANSKPDAEELKNFWEIICRQKGNKISHKLIHYIVDRRQHRDRWVNALIETTVPLRLINGPEDPVSGKHAAERYKELIPQPDVVLLAGIGHYPQTENAEGVWENYWAFVQKYINSQR
jgi:pimeloyl-ACP methyl ester carboxylesterase